MVELKSHEAERKFQSDNPSSEFHYTYIQYDRIPEPVNQLSKNNVLQDVTTTSNQRKGFHAFGTTQAYGIYCIG